SLPGRACRASMRRSFSTSCCSGPGGGAPRSRVWPAALKPAAWDRVRRPMAISGDTPPQG
ncbi:hypothetical protein, partial [Synechococcus sp. BA-132 BA5]|uniref:hypothetical protein n=1 Tax=Synechococcus sp. BA-132 BA5 TaxID=3110252 RepID=UPI002B205948